MGVGDMRLFGRPEQGAPTWVANAPELGGDRTTICSSRRWTSHLPLAVPVIPVAREHPHAHPSARPAGLLLAGMMMVFLDFAAAAAAGMMTVFPEVGRDDDVPNWL